MLKRPFVLFMIVFLVPFISFGQSNVKYGLGNYAGVTVTSSSDDSTAINTLMQDGFLPNISAASRFLSQASFGAPLDTVLAAPFDTIGTGTVAQGFTIRSVSEQGIEEWIDHQMGLTNSFSIQDYVLQLHQLRVDSLNLLDTVNCPPLDPCTIFNVGASERFFDIAWFQGVMTQPDQLRQRVALALSEIFVISRESTFDDNPYAFADYYDMLLDHSFGNYRHLIDSISYHPAMAVYLTFMNNPATDTTNNTFPDQNYAREIMQLFSIGLHELNIDGTEKLDGLGQPIPTYHNEDIEGLAEVFTGFSWADSDRFGDRSNDDWSYTKPLKFYEINERLSPDGPAHDVGPKMFLNTTIENALNPEQEIQDALNLLFNHPNVGPFLAKRLIQRLITSNPSPGYIERIANVFNSDDQEARGNIGAMVKAILLDPEARECGYYSDTNFGRLREPFVRYLHLIKGMNLTSPIGTFRNTMDPVYDETGQKVMYSPSVFNFFRPDYSPNGPVQDENLVAPEFQVANAQTLVSTTNMLNDFINRDRHVIDYDRHFSNEVIVEEERPKLDFEPYLAMADDNKLKFLLEQFNTVFAHGRMSDAALLSIENMLKQFNIADENDRLDRVRAALFLVLVSPDYLIFR